MNILYLTLKKEWFDRIASGEKKEEYREIKPYWDTRFQKQFDVVRFRNGYASDAREMLVELLAISKGFGDPDLGAPVDRYVYILRLGKILKKDKLPQHAQEAR